MWEPRVAVEGWALFAVAYLIVAIGVIGGLMVVLLRLRMSPRTLKWSAAACVACAVGLFLWLVGSPLSLAVLLGVGIIPVVLIAVGGWGYASSGAGRDSDAD